jgi:putative flippase GtrA
MRFLNLPTSYTVLIRYIGSGGSAAVINIASLYVLTEFAHIHYVFSEVLAFSIAFFASYFLQKFWTFKDTDTKDIHWQMSWFLIVMVGNLIANASLLFVLVNYVHLWYLPAEIIVAVFLAAITFFVYKYLIFSRLLKQYNSPAMLGVACAFMLTIFLATYALSESPPTWLDEGIITQVAINNALHGPHAVLEVAPNTFMSAGYVSTSYPVTLPIAGVFNLFGIGLVQARIVMVGFILLFVLCAFFFLRREFSLPEVSWSMLLIATFSPLYGNGRNVLGEVPGLFYLFAFLLLVQEIEKKNKPNLVYYVLAGAFLGLTVATKPIFLLLLLPVGIVFLCSLQLFTLKRFFAAAAGFIVPLAVWVYTQFATESITEMLSIYGNPHGNTIGTTLIANVRIFFTEPEALYALLLLAVWIVSIFYRTRKGERVSRAEYIAAGFACLVYLSFLRTEPYYRYFFLGEIVALVYLPYALAALWPRRIPEALRYGLVGCLVVFQLYQSLFHSWVADHFNVRRTAELTELTALSPQQTIFVYQAPEAVVFLPQGMAYYQYIDITPAIKVGKDELPLIAKGIPDAVIVPQENESQLDLRYYRKVELLDRYSLWYKK